MPMKYKFKFEPYKHQREALKKGWNKSFFAFFMDMGTGKSKVLIDNAFILFQQDLIDCLVVVAPKGVYKNWERKELVQHAPDEIKKEITTWSPSKTKTLEKQLKQLLSHTDDVLKIFLINVEALSTARGFAILEKVVTTHRCMLAVDESTTIKSKTASRTKNLIRLARVCNYRRILTGMPITKSPLDLYTQCEFLESNSLGHNSFYTFQNRYAKMIRRSLGSHSFNQIVDYQNLDELNGILDGFSFRVRKEDCLDLPDKVYTKRSVHLTVEQYELYNQLKKAALAIIEGEGKVVASTVLTQIIRLQQVCSGFAKLDDGRMVKVKSNKMNELLSVLEEVDGKVIIWANFTYDIKLIEEELHKKYGKDCCALFYGDTPTENRQRIVEEFQKPKSKLKYFVGQPRTGGFGLTLTEAKTVVYYSNGYDLEIRLQSEDRAHRIGQTNKVTYIDIVAENTTDEKILSALRKKINISTKVMGEDYKDWIV